MIFDVDVDGDGESDVKVMVSRKVVVAVVGFVSAAVTSLVTLL